MAEEDDCEFLGYSPEEPSDTDPSTPIGEVTINRLVWELMARVDGALVAVFPKECDATAENAISSWSCGTSDDLQVLAVVAKMEVDRRIKEHGESQSSS